MLANLFKIAEGSIHLLENRAHSIDGDTQLPSQGCSLQHFAAVERISVFHHSHVLFRDIVDDVPSLAQLS